MKRRLLVGVAILCVSSVGLVAQAAVDVSRQRSAWEGLLTPQTITTLVVVLLYLGSLRQDLQQLKQDMADLKAWREGLSDKLDDRYMTRELSNARYDEMMSRFRRGMTPRGGAVKQ